MPQNRSGQRSYVSAERKFSYINPDVLQAQVPHTVIDYLISGLIYGFNV